MAEEERINTIVCLVLDLAVIAISYCSRNQLNLNQSCPCLFAGKSPSNAAMTKKYLSTFGLVKLTAIVCYRFFFDTDEKFV